MIRKHVVTYDERNMLRKSGLNGLGVMTIVTGGLILHIQIAIMKRKIKIQE